MKKNNSNDRRIWMEYTKWEHVGKRNRRICVPRTKNVKTIYKPRRNKWWDVEYKREEKRNEKIVRR